LKKILVANFLQQNRVANASHNDKYEKKNCFKLFVTMSLNNWSLQLLHRKKNIVSSVLSKILTYRESSQMFF